jgi:tryptophan synthase alpha chain
MSRIAACFEKLRREGRTALVPYITAGDPRPDVTVPLMHALVESGADLIELGIPFSDPMAEGPAIQRACERALAHHVSTRDVFRMIEDFRRTDAATPVVVMGYLNPVEVMGYEEFASAAAGAGADGMITVDLPPEEAQDYVTAMGQHGLDPIFLLSPTTTDARIDRICIMSGGFVYYVALRGVTGASHLDVDEVAQRVARVKSRTQLPVGVGFGINNAEAAAQVARFADAVIVGSAIVKRIADLADRPEAIAADIAKFVCGLRSAIDSVSQSKVVTSA